MTQPTQQQLSDFLADRLSLRDIVQGIAILVIAGAIGWVGVTVVAAESSIARLDIRITAAERVETEIIAALRELRAANAADHAEIARDIKSLLRRP
jgi:hypothetical protein